MYAKVAVGRGRWAKIDPDDVGLVSYCSWYMDDQGFARNSHNQRMHRVILGLLPGKPDVDHHNHDRLDNRRSNLRVATRSQNNANQRKRTGTVSRFKGVWWIADRKKWGAQICVNGKHHRIGRFATEEEAAQAYNRAALAAWGEFALLNEV